MKYLFTFILYSFFCTTLFAQQRKPIKKITFEYHELAYYQEQVILWKKYTEGHKKEEEAWYNYFLANRYANLLSHKPYTESVKEMDELFVRMEKAIPNSFTYNLTKGWQMGVWDKKSFEYLDKAYALKPNHPLVLDELIVRSEVYGPKEKRKAYSQKYYEAQYDSPALLNIAYNILASLEPGAILFTEGDNDTYYLWLLQEVKNYRPDVIVLNTSLAGIDEYRDRLFKEANIILPKEIADSLVMGEEVDPVNKKSIQQNIVRLLAEHSGRPVYLSHTVSEEAEHRKLIKDKLFNVGLASLYSNERIDNVALIKKHIEQDFLLDYILIDFRTDEKASLIKWVNQIYIGPMVSLYKHYVLAGEHNKAQHLKKYLDAIAKDNHLEETIQKCLN